MYGITLQSEIESEVVAGVEAGAEVADLTISVKPNPTNGVVSVLDVEVAAISVLDVTGKEVRTVLGTNAVNLEGLQTGVYLLVVTKVDGNVETVKVVKE